jgi:hypothetical protein
MKGGGFKNEGEKLVPEKDLKPNTPARENPRTVSESRTSKDREDHTRMLEQYESVGRTIQAEREQRMAAREENRRFWREGVRHRWEGGRNHRIECAKERNCRATQGMYRGPVVEISEEERQKILSSIAEKQMKLKENTKGLGGCEW